MHTDLVSVEFITITSRYNCAGVALRLFCWHSDLPSPRSRGCTCLSPCWHRLRGRTEAEHSCLAIGAAVGNRTLAELDVYRLKAECPPCHYTRCFDPEKLERRLNRDYTWIAIVPREVPEEDGVPDARAVPRGPREEYPASIEHGG